MRKTKTHCKRGHALTKENRYKETRECNQCRRDRARLFRFGETLPDTKRIFRWSPADIQILITMYANHSDSEIAKAIGGHCNKSSVQRRRLRMKLKKNDEFYPVNYSVAVRKVKVKEYEPIQRISRPTPGVTIHRMMR